MPMEAVRERKQHEACNDARGGVMLDSARESIETLSTLGARPERPDQAD